MKPRLSASLAAWGGADFVQVLETELAGLDPASLPLATTTGYVDTADLTLSLIRQAEAADCLRLRIGVFFQEIIAGCSCGDDPAREPAWCELELVIDKADGKTTIQPVP